MKFLAPLAKRTGLVAALVVLAAALSINTSASLF
jgi:hypothetical protein